MHCTDKNSQHSSIICSVLLYGSVFVYELTCCQFESCWSHLWEFLSDYGEENHHYRSSIQLHILKTKFIDSNEKTISAVINHVKNNITEQTDFYPEIITLLKLYLPSPASNDVGKRSASPMCHIKNWVRSTVTRKIESLYASFNTWKNWWNKPERCDILWNKWRKKMQL